MTDAPALFGKKPRRHQLVDVCSFGLGISCIVFSEKNRQDLDRRMEAEFLRAIPALQARYADARLRRWVSVLELGV